MSRGGRGWGGLRGGHWEEGGASVLSVLKGHFDSSLTMNELEARGALAIAVRRNSGQGRRELVLLLHQLVLLHAAVSAAHDCSRFAFTHPVQ